jgi:hypothetical protein
VLIAAGMAVATLAASSAALELAMASGLAARLYAREAAEAGLAATLRAREWSVAAPSAAAGSTAEGGEWQTEVRLAAARLDAGGTPVEWHFEIESHGRHGQAWVTLLQGFRISGALPGEPDLSWWRQAGPPP